MRKNEKIPINQENQLHQYAAAGNFEALKESIDALIKQRMSIETIFNLPHTEYGTRFLSFAIQYGRLKLIKDLADEYSSKINLGNCIAKDDILCCCLVSRSEYRTEMLPYFLKNAKKFNLSEANIKAALGDQDYFQRSPNTLLTPDQNGLTPLYYAIIAKQEDIIALKPEATLGDIIQVNGQDRRGLAAAYYNLGLAYVSRRDYGSAIKAYKEAIELRKQITVPIDQDR
ncbi:MAG: tetratricopeptide repeat protein, partial [Coxiellaceae bacterium]|nr:tetratricopeptide repeat protein [Coxiellaceae bacterium]